MAVAEFVTLIVLALATIGLILQRTDRLDTKIDARFDKLDAKLDLHLREDHGIRKLP